MQALGTLLEKWTFSVFSFICSSGSSHTQRPPNVPDTKKSTHLTFKLGQRCTVTIAHWKAGSVSQSCYNHTAFFQNEFPPCLRSFEKEAAALRLKQVGQTRSWHSGPLPGSVHQKASRHKGRPEVQPSLQRSPVGVLKAKTCSCLSWGKKNKPLPHPTLSSFISLEQTEPTADPGSK